MSGLKLPEGFTWGQQQAITVPPNGRSSRVQLMSIQHPFPESWRFLLWAEVLQSDPGVSVSVEFELFTGVGQTRADLTRSGAGFQQLRWNPGSSRRDPKWTTKFRGPLRDDADPTSFVEGEVIVGRSLVISAVGANNPTLVPTEIQVMSLWAPNVNARSPVVKESEQRRVVSVPRFDDEDDGNN